MTYAVRTPTNADEAAGMMREAVEWMQTWAPDVLRATMRATEYAKEGELNGAAGDSETSRTPSAWPAVRTTASGLSHFRKRTNMATKGTMMTDDEKMEFLKRGRSWKELDDATLGYTIQQLVLDAVVARAGAVQRIPLDDSQALDIARKHLDTGLSWAPRITRCNDVEIRALIRAVEAAHGICDA